MARIVTESQHNAHLQITVSETWKMIWEKRQARVVDHSHASQLHSKTCQIPANQTIGLVQMYKLANRTRTNDFLKIRY